MGTNFYVDADATCNNPAHTEQLHIGKSSGGWKFGHRGYPDLGLMSWEAWLQFLPGRVIHDEYGREVSLPELRSIVENRVAPRGRGQAICRIEPDAWERAVGFGDRWMPPDPEREFHDPAGNDFTIGEFS